MPVQPKIIIVSDGTPGGSKVYLNGQELSCDGCYFNFLAPQKEGDYTSNGYLSLELNRSVVDDSGARLNVTYRLSPPPTEALATKASKLTFKREIKDGKPR